MSHNHLLTNHNQFTTYEIPENSKEVEAITDEILIQEASESSSEDEEEKLSDEG